MSASASLPLPSVSGPGLTSFAGLDVLDLELLHHYTTSTYGTLPSGATPDEHQLWQIQVVQLGFHHEFLLRGILAVAALHLAYLQNTKPRRESSSGSGRSRETLLLRASAHQSIAVRLFYEALNHVQASNCTAIFAFSCIIVALTFATPKGATTAADGDDDDRNNTTSSPAAVGGVQKEILDWFYMVRGCNSVLQTQWPTLSRSFLAPLLKRGMMHETAASQEVRDTASHAHVTDLLGLCSASDRTRTSTATATSPSQGRGNGRDRERQAASGLALAVHELLNAYTQVSILTDRQQNFVPVIFVWPIAIPQSYLGLLSERRPEAMIILAHYAALLQRVDDQWYMRGWGQYLVQQIDAALGQEWQSWLEWPKQVTGIETPN